MKVLSFNVLCYGNGIHHYKDRAPRVLGQIADEAPALFGVQEATPEWMEILKERFCPEYGQAGIGRDGGGKGEASAIFYKADEFDFESCGDFWLSETPDKPSKGWDAACIRICSYAVLRDKATGRRFAMINTHLDHRGPVAMVKGCEMVVKKALELDMPVVMTGDFNNTPDSEVYRLIREAGIDDTRVIAKHSDTLGTFTDFGKDPDKYDTIDYIFTRGFRAETFKVKNEVCEDGEFASDHLAITAEIEFAD